MEDINRQFAALAEKIWEEQGIIVERVIFDWIDIGSMNIHQHVLNSVEVHQKSFKR